MSSLKPCSSTMLREWREIGTTGSTDGQYECKRRTFGGDFPWLIEHWGIEPRGVQELVKGAIDVGGLGHRHLDGLMKHCPEVAEPVLRRANLVHLAINSRCATGNETTMRQMQAAMATMLVERGFPVETGDKAAVDRLCSEIKAKQAELVRVQAAKKEQEEKAKRKVHPGRLETFDTDLSGMDSRDLRHVEATLPAVVLLPARAASFGVPAARKRSHRRTFSPTPNRHTGIKLK